MYEQSTDDSSRQKSSASLPHAGINFRCVEANTKAHRRDFLNLPQKIYREYPKWIPQPDFELRRRLDPKSNPFLTYARIKLFSVYDRRGTIVGRIASIHNPVHRQLHGDNTGFFGLFECIDDLEVARLLFDATRRVLLGYGCTDVAGPVNLNTNEEVGLLVEGFNEYPMVMCNYAPPYYADLLQKLGFSKAMDLLSYEGEVGHRFPEKYARILDRVSSKRDITVRPFSLRGVSEDIAAIRKIYNGSFQDVWGFVPLTSLEAEQMGKSFLSFSDEKLVWIAEYNRQPAGCILAVRNINEVLKGLNGQLLPFGIFKILFGRRYIKNIRVMVLGVLPAYRSLGIETLLIHKLRLSMREAGYRRAEFSLVMENNAMMRSILEFIGFPITKRYRLFRASYATDSLSAIEAGKHAGERRLRGSLESHISGENFF